MRKHKNTIVLVFLTVMVASQATIASDLKKQAAGFFNRAVAYSRMLTASSERCLDAIELRGDFKTECLASITWSKKAAEAVKNFSSFDDTTKRQALALIGEVDTRAGNETIKSAQNRFFQAMTILDEKLK